ncbi:MAG: (2Fe-2S) ferredoxin domain-containing protein [Cyanobacteria bacterium J06659_2]
MSAPKPIPSRMFNLEGTFLGFPGHALDKPKFIVLEVEQEQVVIKMPKELRAYVRRHLRPGDRIQCIGRSQVDFSTGVIKLKAYQIFSLAAASQDEAATIPPAEARFSATVAPPPKNSAPKNSAAPHSSPRSLGQKRAQILICHKSGCQKRGGRQLIAKLEQVLREQQLWDQVDIKYTGCQKRCSKAPNLTIMPGKHRYDHLNLADLPALIEEHFCVPESNSAANHVDP